MRELTIKEQLKIVRKVQWLFILMFLKSFINNKKFSNDGLCYLFTRSFGIKGYPSYLFSELHYLIPIFTKENAIKYANAKEEKCIFWWNYCYRRNIKNSIKYDYKNRWLFLKWMKCTLKIQSKLIQ